MCTYCHKFHFISNPLVINYFMYIYYMKNSISDKFQGYIEGYYGKILSWDQRSRILDTLNKNNMNSYFYCPKEDIHHRHN